jgi:hypothetical protein
MEMKATLPVSGFGSGAYSEKLLAGTMHLFSGFSQLRQCSEEVLRMLVTGGPLNFGGRGMPQRIMVSSRSAPALRTQVPDSRGTRPAWAAGCRRNGS